MSLEPSFLKHQTVLELGCGTAVASIAALKLGAKRVIATDGNLEVVELARANCKRNGVLGGGGGGVSGESMEGNGGLGGEAALLQWGILDAVEYYDTADIVMGSDLTYNSGTWGVLAETMDAVLKPNGIVIYLSLGHSGFSVAGELGGFQTVLESQGHLDVVSEGSEKWPFRNISSLEMLLQQSLKKEEREIIKTTGGFKILVLKKKKGRSQK